MRRIFGLTLLLLTGCASLGGVSDGSSVAYGFTNAGQLLNGVKIPLRGDGYVVPATWSKRGNNYGTDELVALVVRAARRVNLELPGATLYVADLSPPRGGPSAWHRSHQTGRDADLLFYANDAEGNPMRPPAQMMLFGEDGVTRAAGAKYSFDVPRNWALVRALLEDPAVDVQFLFISEPLKRMLIDYAIDKGEPRELVRRAEAILHQPVGALPHDDHLHVRIYCPLSDRSLGCRDRGNLRWFKKSYKYLAAQRLAQVLPAPLRGYVTRPFCRLLSRGVVAAL